MNVPALVVLLAVCQVYPTGVVTERLPTRSGFKSHGDSARSFVLETIDEQRRLALGDDPPPEATGPPWLVLIGPDDATSQAEGQLPDEVRSLIRVARYQADDPRLERGFKSHYTGGTFAILMRPDRTIAWKGLVELTELLRQINRLLGREPEPSPWDPPPLPPPIPLPGPLNPGGGVSSVYPFALGVLAGWLSVALVVGLIVVVMTIRRWLASIRLTIAAINAASARPAGEPTASAGPARKGGGKST